MQLQIQLLGENTRVLTDVQDVTADVSTHITSTPKKNPQTDVTQLGRSTYSSPAYSGPMYTTQTPLTSRSMPATTSTASQTKPKKTLATTFRRREHGHGLEEWDLQGEVHEVPFMVNLREELRMQM